MINLKNINPNKLHDELIQVGIYPISVCHDGKENVYIAENTTIDLAEDADMDLVQQIIDNHDPTPLPKALTEIELLQEENIQLKTRLYETESMTAETGAIQEMLIELLLDMGVM